MTDELKGSGNHGAKRGRPFFSIERPSPEKGQRREDANTSSSENEPGPLSCLLELPINIFFDFTISVGVAIVLASIALVLMAPIIFEWENAGDFYYATLSATVFGGMPFWIFWRSLDRRPRTMMTHRVVLFLIVIVTFIFLILSRSNLAMTGPTLIFAALGISFRIDYSRVKQSTRA